MRILGVLLWIGIVGLATFSLQAQVKDKGKTPVAKPTLEAPRGEGQTNAAFPTYLYKEPISVTLKCATADAKVRYTLDGTIPTDAEDGMLFTEPIRIDKKATIVAVGFKEGMAPSPPVTSIYLVGESAQPGMHTLHIGNSLTDTTNRFTDYARTAGFMHEYRSLTAGGALTYQLWDNERSRQAANWKKSLTELGKIDHITVQPRDFDLSREALNDIKFFNLAREKSPDVQPWLYCEWVEKNRGRPSDQGKVKSSQMKTLYPALTWEESMGAMLLYVEELQLNVMKTYKGNKKPRIIPSAIAMGQISDMIERGKFPGMKGGSFYPLLFSDNVHPSANGAFLVDCTWYAAFYGESPEGKVLPIGTTLTAAQAEVMQQIAWKVVKNYPESGLFEEGKKAVAKPSFDPPPSPIKDVKQVELNSSTPETLFRYTLDGTTPTRTTGYVYCGIISVRPGMTVKAIAFSSGMADSPVIEGTWMEKKKDAK